MREGSILAGTAFFIGYHMYKAIIYSVPGTGTRFVCKYATECLEYLRVVSVGSLMRWPNDNVYLHTHSKSVLKRLMNFHGTRMIIPLRDPYRAYLTRLKTYKSEEGAQTSMAGLWETLMTAEEQFKVVYLPVDHVNLDRRKVLKSIANFMDVDYDEAVLNQFADAWLSIGASQPSASREEYERSKLIKGQHVTFLKEAQDWYFYKVGELEKL